MRVKISSFGDYVRELRKKEGLPLRKVAAELDIDPSTLGKIEKNTRRASRQMVREMSRVFKTDYKPLIINSLER
jgi:transcriptional regulator with XRE-family HTH domain